MKSQNKIGIIGQNVLFNNNVITAYYIIRSINYDILSEEVINEHITSLETIIGSLATKYSNIRLSILNIDKIITKHDMEQNLLDTIHIYDPSYKEIPEIFKKHITNQEQRYSLLAVNIDNSSITDLESLTIKEVIKSGINKATNALFSTGINIDVDKILRVEQIIYNIFQDYALRASKDIVYYTLLSSLFPSYNISYQKNSFLANRNSDILGSIKQEIQSRFGYFEMYNNGVEIFGLPNQVTYGSILKITNFPSVIDSDNFNLNIPNLRVNIKCIPKETIEKRFRRTKADIEYELKQAEIAEAVDTTEFEEGMDLSEIAIENVKNGQSICEMNANILVLGQSIEELRSKRQKVITMLANTGGGITSTISLNQGFDFINNYVKLSPNKYDHMVDLRFPLSFQLDTGVLVGDADSEFTSPAIGMSII